MTKPPRLAGDARRPRGSPPAHVWRWAVRTDWPGTHGKGKLDGAGPRIDHLLDPGTFSRNRLRLVGGETAADGIVVGSGLINWLAGDAWAPKDFTTLGLAASGPGGNSKR